MGSAGISCVDDKFLTNLGEKSIFKSCCPPSVSSNQAKVKALEVFSGQRSKALPVESIGAGCLFPPLF
jgi:hypothetical protein